MSTAIAQRPVTTSNMIGGQTHSQKQQRRQISKRQQQQQRKSYEHNKNTRIDSNPRITKITTNNNNTSKPSNSYPNIVNFYVVTSALSKCLLLLQNTDLGLIPSYLKNNFAERSIINEKIARQVNDFNQYVAEKEKVPKNMNTTNFVISRRHSRLLNKLDVDLLNEKQKDSLRGINLESKQPTKKQELENPLAEATSQIIIDALSETDDLTKVGANIYKYLEKCGQTPQNLFDSLLKVNARYGCGTTRDQEKVFYLHHSMAKKGGADAQCALGY
ncbi:5583_t:CDS:2 [Ambispora leptoticha]|uniref:5583_t:CDS:1 n=1 Tax=Ambispora leptoticha TaxID=144679 RepID=A0A9N9C6Z1_9GLOM|nr:5583_t:CDS:2 [Ambispora leptoticha]